MVNEQTQDVELPEGYLGPQVKKPKGFWYSKAKGWTEQGLRELELAVEVFVSPQALQRGYKAAAHQLRHAMCLEKRSKDRGYPPPTERIKAIWGKLQKGRKNTKRKEGPNARRFPRDWDLIVEEIRSTGYRNAADLQRRNRPCQCAALDLCNESPEGKARWEAFKSDPNNWTDTCRVYHPDTLYLYRSTLPNGRPFFKIGITSRGIERVREVISEAGSTRATGCLIEFGNDDDSKKVEKHLLAATAGEALPQDYYDGNGSTEMRYDQGRTFSYCLSTLRYTACYFEVEDGLQPFSLTLGGSAPEQVEEQEAPTLSCESQLSPRTEQQRAATFDRWRGLMESVPVPEEPEGL